MTYGSDFLTYNYDTRQKLSPCPECGGMPVMILRLPACIEDQANDQLQYLECGDCGWHSTPSIICDLWPDPTQARDTITTWNTTCDEYEAFKAGDDL